MNKILLLITTVLFSFVLLPLSAQQTEIFTPGGTSNTIVRLHFITLGGSLEQAVAPKVSMFFDLSYGSDYTNDPEGQEVLWCPYFSFEPRYYFNLDRREARGKRTDYFSSQFVTFQTRIGFPAGSINTWYSFAPMWGFQRSIGKRWYWSFQIGPGLQGSAGRIYSDFNGDFKLGIIL